MASVKIPQRFGSFLYADPTPNALQAFVARGNSGANADISGLPEEQGNEKGVWISADPIPGCVVCNIGVSKLVTFTK